MHHGTFKNDTKMTIPNIPTTGRVICCTSNANGSDYFGLRNSFGINRSGSFVEAATSMVLIKVSRLMLLLQHKMGVVITYTDHAGTATLNTDLKVFFQQTMI